MNIKMSESTRNRALSALAMLSAVIIFLILGTNFVLLAFYSCGAIICDELLVNFFKVKRDSKTYFYSGLVYFGFILSSVMLSEFYLSELFIFFNILLCSAQLFFLFEWNSYALSLAESLKKWKFLSPLMIFLPIHSACQITKHDSWRVEMVGLILLVILADTGAWFVGKKFGKTKLFPSVSPNKTKEGALGGVLICVVGLYFYSYFFLSSTGSEVIVTFFILSVLSVLGDLIQSKLKRRFEIKDSSQLIPGHGGLYDRMDSLLFIAPFYLLFV